MPNSLVRSFGNSDAHPRREDEGFGLWREIDRVFDNLARSFGRDSEHPAQRGFARDVLAPDESMPEIPLNAGAHPQAFGRHEPHRSHELHRPHAEPPRAFAAEETPRPSTHTPSTQARSEVIATPAQPTPIRINRSATPANTGPMTPVADAYEDEDNFEITVELPGIRPDDIDIEFAEGGLNVTAERKRATEPGDEKKHHVRERAFGTFKRRFPIPFQANPDIIQAAFEDGIVIVTVPRPPETKPRVKKIGLKRA